MVAIQIQAQSLRQSRYAARTVGFGPLGFATGGAVASVETATDWEQSDVERAIAAAQDAELRSYRVEISPKGAISIIVGAPSETEPPDDTAESLRGL